MSYHWAILINNQSDKPFLIDGLLTNNPPFQLNYLAEKRGLLFSNSTIRDLVHTELRHGTSIISDLSSQELNTMSSGERKKMLLHYILNQHPDFIILDNPFDNLDKKTQHDLSVKLTEISKRSILIQLASRKTDLLPFIKNYAFLDNKTLDTIKDLGINTTVDHKFNGTIPPPITPVSFKEEVLVHLEGVNVSYLEKKVLDHITWTIKKGDFWELRGPNGSGKSTILSMITGENPKGYGQELFIFGNRKGSGETVWDIKKRIGYFTPSMLDTFTGYHSIEHMLISGLNDSIGLYVQPTATQLRIAKEWLLLLKMYTIKDRLYNTLSTGQKRVLMCARAMIKHPVLLILDEPTAGLDDTSAAFFVSLANKFSRESESALVFVSHRTEPNLEPEKVYLLTPHKTGSTGRIL